MRNLLSVSLLTLALVALLPACNQVEKAATDLAEQGKAVASAAAGAASGDTAWAEKANKYISVANSLNHFVDVARNEHVQKSKEKAEAAVRAGDFKKANTVSHAFSDHTVQSLKEALAMSAKTEGVDTAGKALVAAIDKYLPDWKALESYNKAKKFEDDGGAEGKRLLPIYIEGQDALRTAVLNFRSEVDKVATELQQKNLAKYKAEGKLLEMHTLVALGSAEKILQTFKAAEDFKVQAKIDEANRQLESLDAAVKGIREEHAKRKAADASGSNRTLPVMDRHEEIVAKLETLSGAYRESRKDPSRFDDVIEAYNGAVDEYNRM